MALSVKQMLAMAKKQLPKTLNDSPKATEIVYFSKKYLQGLLEKKEFKGLDDIFQFRRPFLITADGKAKPIASTFLLNGNPEGKQLKGRISFMSDGREKIYSLVDIEIEFSPSDIFTRTGKFAKYL